MPAARSRLSAVLLLSAVGLLSLADLLVAQSGTPCSAPEHRQFDFWVGDWTVTTPGGALAGTNRIERTVDGCVLQEHWVGSKGGSGTSLNMWVAADRKWHQVWMDTSGSMLELKGALEGSQMILSGEHPTAGASGGVTIERITWTPQPGGTVRQLWESSKDGGASWTTQFDGVYTRKP